MQGFISGRVLLLSVMVVGMLSTSACSSKSDTKVGQAVARVDDYELTVHQLNGELRNIPANAAGQDEAAKLKSQALESLIERQLLVAEGARAKLDRDPNVMQAIERSKNQIIADALLQRKFAAVAPPAPSEVEAYYEKNPMIFGKRKLFEMKQIAIPAEAYTDEMKAFVESGRSVGDVVGWLDSHKLQYATMSSFVTTADLPPPVIQKLDEVSSGRPFVIKGVGRAMIASLHFIKDAPVGVAEAKPQIEQYLMGEKMRMAANEETTRLKAKAKIEYLNGSIAGKTQAPVKAEPSSPAENNQPSENVISKGVSGLK